MWVAGRVVCLALLVAFLNHEGGVFCACVFSSCVSLELVARVECPVIAGKTLLFVIVGCVYRDVCVWGKVASGGR